MLTAADSIAIDEWVASVRFRSPLDVEAEVTLLANEWLRRSSIAEYVQTAVREFCDVADEDADVPLEERTSSERVLCAITARFAVSITTVGDE